MEILKLFTGLDIKNMSASGLITPLAVLFIVCVFSFFLYNLLKNIQQLKRKISHLNRNSTEEEFKKVFGNLWIDYKNSFIKYPFGEKTHAHASEYFNSAHLLSKSMGLPLLTSASNILVGLGVLGTFMGLTIGISGFDTSTSDTIKESIQGLLTGMGSAFLTSVWGMLLSLLITVIEKYQTGKLQVRLYNLCYEIDYIFHFNKEDEYKLREIDLTNIFDRYFIYNDENNNKISIPQLLHDNYNATDKMCGAIQSFSTDLATKIEVGFESIINSDSLNEILPSLHAVKAEIVKLNTDIKNPATEMMETLVDELKGAINTMIRDMRESMSETTTKDLTDITQILASSSQALLELPSSLARMTSDLENSFKGMKQNISDASDKAVDQSKQGINSANEMMIHTAENMGRQFDLITTNLTLSFENIGKRLEELSEQSNTHSKSVINDLHKILTDTTQSTQQQIKSNQDSQNQLNEKQIEAIKSIQNLLIQFQQSIEKLTAVNTAVGTTINETSKLQNDVSNSCDTLAHFSDVIRRSSDNFVNTQQQFKNFSNDFINDNMQLIDRLQLLVKESTEGTTANIDRYNTINTGIESIFEKIQTGLEQYQKTVDEGVKSSLTKYTESLTQVAENLCGASNAQHELLEDITEAITNIKR